MTVARRLARAEPPLPAHASLCAAVPKPDLAALCQCMAAQSNALASQYPALPALCTAGRCLSFARLGFALALPVIAMPLHWFASPLASERSAKPLPDPALPSRRVAGLSTADAVRYCALPPHCSRCRARAIQCNAPPLLLHAALGYAHACLCESMLCHRCA